MFPVRIRHDNATRVYQKESSGGVLGRFIFHGLGLVA